jgi:hypothetical protein
MVLCDTLGVWSNCMVGPEGPDPCSAKGPNNGRALRDALCNSEGGRQASSDGMDAGYGREILLAESVLSIVEGLTQGPPGRSTQSIGK